MAGALSNLTHLVKINFDNRRTVDRRIEPQMVMGDYNRQLKKGVNLTQISSRFG